MAMETGTAAAAQSTRRLLLPLAVSFLLCALAAGTKPPPSSSYIVYLGAHSHRAGVSTEEASTVATESHYDLLGSVLGE